MKFDLTPEIIDQIIFGMENQAGDFIFDTKAGTVIPIEEAEEDTALERYIAMPEWNSVKGFQLMEKFVATLRNPVYRESLRNTLSSGKGVFRNFKNVLKQRADIERLWFAYKEKEMKRLVIEWYNQQCEVWGYEKIEMEPEDTESLVLSDFTIREGGQDRLEAIEKFDRLAFFEANAYLPEAYVKLLYTKRCREATSPLGENSYIFWAETPGNEMGGFIWGIDEIINTDPKETDLKQLSAHTLIISNIYQLFVVEEYRGLGLAKTLLETYIKKALHRHVDKLQIELPGTSMILSNFLSPLGFSLGSQKLIFDLAKAAVT
ncbi:MAG: GNAT family N-acetyltransferase [Spirochaetota bacterium]